MYSFGVIMDPIEKADINKDSTVAIVSALQKKSKILNYCFKILVSFFTLKFLNLMEVW